MHEFDDRSFFTARDPSVSAQNPYLISQKSSSHCSKSSVLSVIRDDMFSDLPPADTCDLN
jgi:hypothetical protein